MSQFGDTVEERMKNILKALFQPVDIQYASKRTARD